MPESDPTGPTRAHTPAPGPWTERGELMAASSDWRRRTHPAAHARLRAAFASVAAFVALGLGLAVADRTWTETQSATETTTTTTSTTTTADV